MNITINQSTTNQESAPNGALSKLVGVMKNNGTVNIKGNIYIQTTTQKIIDYLCNRCNLVSDANNPGTYRSQNLIISIGTISIGFEDPYVESKVISDLISAGIISDASDPITIAETSSFVVPRYWFQNNTDIQTFDEFQYFTNTSLSRGNIFQGCTNLRSITVNSSLGANSFQGCTSLSNVTLLSGCTSIGDACFAGCSSLIEFDFKNAVISGGNIFGKNQLGLQNLWLKKIVGASYLSKPSFGCLRAIEEINNIFYTTGSCSKGIIATGQSATNNLNQAVCLKNTSDAVCCFHKCGSIYLYVPSIVQTTLKNNGDYNADISTHAANDYYTYFGYQRYYNSGGKTGIQQVYPFMYFKDLQYVGAYTFDSIQVSTIVINNTTPPTFVQSIATSGTLADGNTDIFAGATKVSLKIYVPHSAVSAYEADQYWGQYTIYDMDNLTHYATNELWEEANRPNDSIIDEFM